MVLKTNLLLTSFLKEKGLLVLQNGESTLDLLKSIRVARRPHEVLGARLVAQPKDKPKKGDKKKQDGLPPKVLNLLRGYPLEPSRTKRSVSCNN
jgi:hypothetical protein